MPLNDTYRVVLVHRDRYLVRNEGEELYCVLSGSLRYREEYPVVGDRVEITVNPYGDSLIQAILPRRTVFCRPDRGGHADGFVKTLQVQPLIANIDYVFIITSLNRDFSLNRIARYAAMAAAGGAVLSDAQGVDAARAFLLARGYGEMELSYSSRFEGILTANFAAVQNGVVLYPDLVKVQVSMADGTVVGLEAANWLMNHVPRTIEVPALSESDAVARIGGALTPVSARLCVIPDNAGEALCYEVRATAGSDTFLAYIDAMTGVERRLMQVISDENGAKVM